MDRQIGNWDVEAAWTELKEGLLRSAVCGSLWKGKDRKREMQNCLVE